MLVDLENRLGLPSPWPLISQSSSQSFTPLRPQSRPNPAWGRRMRTDSDLCSPWSRALGKMALKSHEIRARVSSGSANYRTRRELEGTSRKRSWLNQAISELPGTAPVYLPCRRSRARGLVSQVRARGVSEETQTLLTLSSRRAPVAQWIEQRSPKARARVRLTPGASSVKGGCSRSTFPELMKRQRAILALTKGLRPIHCR